MNAQCAPQGREGEAIAPTVQPHVPQQRPQAGGFQPCLHREGCRYLALVISDVADVSLACGAVCYDAVRER